MGTQLRRIAQFLDERKNPFFLSRLIMMSGVDLRAASGDADDDPDALQKVRAALASLLETDELIELEGLLDA